MKTPDLESRYRVSPDRFRLADQDPADTAGLDHERSRERAHEPALSVPDEAERAAAAEAVRLLEAEG